jgi:hypothetical protein
MRKLGQHWSHRFPVAFEGEDRCRIEMPNATCELHAHPDHLDVRVTSEKAEDQDRLQSVVEEHVKRFAFREQLQFDWNRETSGH